MTERPILMCAEMVRAVLTGQKSQTRRIIKPQPPEGCTVGWSAFSGESRIECRSYAIPHQSFIKCPWKIRNHVWVKETFARLPCSRSEEPCLDCQNCRDGRVFKADDPERELPVPWKPSIFMPRWASRLTLEIVSVRVERVQDIGWKDILAEGVISTECAMQSTARLAFKKLWDSLNAKRGYGWDENPWVWRIEFKIIRPGTHVTTTRKL